MERKRCLNDEILKENTRETQKNKENQHYRIAERINRYRKIENIRDTGNLYYKIPRKNAKKASKNKTDLYFEILKEITKKASRSKRNLYHIKLKEKLLKKFQKPQINSYHILRTNIEK